MKTRKTLKITGLIQLVYGVLMIANMVISIVYARYQIPISRDATLFKILDFYGGFAVVLWYVPTAITCFIINLTVFLKERKDLEHRRNIGIRWLSIPIGFLSVLAIKYFYFWHMIISIVYQEHFPV